jgi:hypothetical protein
VEPAAARSLLSVRAEWLANQPEFAGQLGAWSREGEIDQVFFEKELPPAFERAIEYTGFALAEFKRRVEADGGRLVVLAASNVRGRGNADADLFFERLRALTDRLNVDVLDQYAWLAERSEAPATVQFRHDGHWNARGHEVAAEMVVDYLARHGDACVAKRR